MLAPMRAIKIKPSHRGLLHKRLHVPPGEKIPKEKIAAAANSADPSLRKQANFAKNASTWNKL